LTQIPESVTAALIAGVNPARGLQATWLMNVITSLIGGRPGMISGSTPFIGVALMNLVDDHGVDYIFYAVMFGGFLQMLFGLMGLGALMRFVPYTVVQGFSNAMALVIFAAQFRYGKVSSQGYHDEFEYNNRNLVDAGHSWSHIIDTESSWITGSSLIILSIHAVVAFLICLVLPRFTRIIPSSFVAIVICTFVEHVLIRVPSEYESATIGNYVIVKTPTLKPIWVDETITAPGFNFDTFKKIYLHGLAIFGTGLAESLLTTQIVDELTEVKGMKNRVCFGQGVANVFSACFGGMGGSGSIAQSIVANHSDGITGLCSFLAGSFVLLFIYAAYAAVNIVPLGCVAGIMSWTVSTELWDLPQLI
jgi:SulP family sulfate permease